jgi:hypothetical protein
MWKIISRLLRNVRESLRRQDLSEISSIHKWWFLIPRCCTIIPLFECLEVLSIYRLRREGREFLEYSIGLGLGSSTIWFCQALLWLGIGKVRVCPQEVTFVGSVEDFKGNLIFGELPLKMNELLNLLSRGLTRVAYIIEFASLNLLLSVHVAHGQFVVVETEHATLIKRFRFLILGSDR